MNNQVMTANIGNKGETGSRGSNYLILCTGQKKLNVSQVTGFIAKQRDFKPK